MPCILLLFGCFCQTILAQNQDITLELSVLDKDNGTAVAIQSYQVFYQAEGGQTTLIGSKSVRVSKVALPLPINYSGSYLILLNADKYFARQVRFQMSTSIRPGSIERLEVQMQPKVEIEDVDADAYTSTYEAYNKEEGKWPAGDPRNAGRRVAPTTAVSPTLTEATPRREEFTERRPTVVPSRTAQPIPPPQEGAAPTTRTVPEPTVVPELQPPVRPSEPAASGEVPVVVEVTRFEIPEDAVYRPTPPSQVVTEEATAAPLTIQPLQRSFTPLEESEVEEPKVVFYRLRFDSALKAESSSGSTSLLHMRVGDQVQLIYKTAKNDFWRVRTADGREGYLRPRYLERVDER